MKRPEYSRGVIRDGKQGKVLPVPPFFRVFRAFRGSNSLMLCIIAGTEKPNQ